MNPGVFSVKDPSIKRHLLKTVTWRIVGTIDTVLLGWLITGNPVTGLKIGMLELITKMVLYFLHERVWYRINFGLPHRTTIKDERKESDIQA
jgi:uncharacterized membrane protein